jgi:8-oxo-dGTP pyrophosphatase MutT (NUDIX family)
MEPDTSLFTQAVVVLLFDQDNRVCLARKKQAIHNQQEGEEISYSLGMYNGYGGKREPDDSSLLATAVREVKDECGVLIDEKDLVPSIRVFFSLVKNNQEVPFQDVTFFTAHTWSSYPEESSEMTPPQFFAQDAVPYHEMMPADSQLFPLVFACDTGTYKVTLYGKGVAPKIEKI